ncbi:helix-turn-helix transcriptional regulator [Dehalobacter restrictus]|uniref:helix-turn-helix domain-containing protein n=1 Tax=Dehalobacter restrictus TaxID=55583 RepID=UPI00338EBF68
MTISYNKLWKLMIDRKIKKVQLKNMAKLGSTTLAKLGKDEPVSMDVLIRICQSLRVNIGDIMDVNQDDQ